MSSVARAGLAQYCQRVLAVACADESAGDAVRRLAQRGMDPPRQGRFSEHATGAEVRERLERWTQPDRRQAAAAVLTLPNADAPWRVVEVAAEVFLAGHDPRIVDLADAIAASPEISEQARSACGLWRFRWALGAVDASDEGQVATCLEELRALSVLPEHLAEALRLAAAWVIDESSAVGAEWMVSCFGGRHVANVSLSTLRRPALRDELAAAVGWLEEAAELSAGGRGEVFERLWEAERADRAGDVGAGTDGLRDALALSAERDDLRRALDMRRTALMSDVSGPSLGDMGAIIAALSPTGVRGQWPEPTALPPPTSGWSESVETGAAEVPSEVEKLALLEAAGSLRRAAQGWLLRGDLESLLHAFRLRDAMTDAMRAALLAGLADTVTDDEVVLASSPQAFQGAAALRVLVGSEGHAAEIVGLGLRLRAAAHAHQKPQGEDLQRAKVDADDPHSVANRLAAAEDLVSAGRLEAAATVASALLKHVVAPQDRRAWVGIARELLSASTPPPAFVGAVERLIASGEPDSSRKRTSRALMDALIGSPMMAYPLHASLYRAAAEAAELTDLERLRCLEAWLGIWKATATPPALEAVRKLARSQLTLLALAAFRLAGDVDPVDSARDFIQRYPARTTSASTLADALLTASTS